MICFFANVIKLYSDKKHKIEALVYIDILDSSYLVSLLFIVEVDPYAPLNSKFFCISNVTLVYVCVV